MNDVSLGATETWGTAETQGATRARQATEVIR
jgi:hypothetical protein